LPIVSEWLSRDPEHNESETRFETGFNLFKVNYDKHDKRAPVKIRRYDYT